MKTITFVVLLGMVLTNCKREENTPVEPLMETVDSLAVVNAKGSFTGVGGESVSGTARIITADQKYSLVLDQFSTNNGPDLHVYLSKQATPKDFIDLGSLKSTRGTQVYEINGKPDFTEYKYALIHCQQFNHLFGSALLTDAK
ncbi:DM13 domain-containing protein [Dyadobacter pollutisoli]|uniref:DM13 domain-containing protein n=1 Tax=Dyadobacter pollutisoli TaxID=2910158 RepID=A0A9E8NFP9_9BACT|nr:DM13 domain-containing protein [Dyadobacter pollutisoli]WAC13437.1 DM13 domain-containing protein [Dyadobacter pollutisoli]